MATLHVFGGGRLVHLAANLAHAMDWGVVWRTSPRLHNPSESEESVPYASGVRPFVANRLADAMMLGPTPNYSTDIAISFGSPWIFSREWLKPWCGRALNLHSTRLPRHRGGGGGSWQVMMQDTLGAATLHVLTPGIDDGPLVAQSEFEYSSPMTAATFAEETYQESAKLLARHLPSLMSKGWEVRSQSDTGALYWPRLHTDTHGWIDWSWGRDEIVAFISAFDKPYFGASTFHRQRRVRLFNAEPKSSEVFHPFQAGLVVHIEGERFFVVTAQGLVSVYVPEATDSARVGDRLFTPSSVLDGALSKRAELLPSGDWRFSESAPNVDTRAP